MQLFGTTILQKLSDSRPANRSLRKVSTKELSEAVEDLFLTKFKGLAEASATQIDEFVMISADQFAYLLKSLLKFVDGRAYLYVNFTVDDDEFKIEFILSPPIALDFSEQTALASSAYASGFSIDHLKDKTLLTVKLESSRSRQKSVYEQPDINLAQLLDTLFFE